MSSRPRAPASSRTSSTVSCRSARASPTELQMPVITSTHDSSSSYLALGCRPPPRWASRSRISEAPERSSPVSWSTSSSSHSTPMEERGEPLKGICTHPQYRSRPLPTPPIAIARWLPSAETAQLGPSEALADRCRNDLGSRKLHLAHLVDREARLVLSVPPQSLPITVRSLCMRRARLFI